MSDGRRIRLAHLMVSIVGLVAGCAAPAAPVGSIQHIVLVRLSDPADAPALVAECDQVIRPIPSVRSYACGPPFDSGRANVDGGYDVGLVLRFADRAGYEAYVADPDHVAFVDRWRSRCTMLRIHDIVEERPEPGSPVS
ncbi:MAG: Dabb family protein [Phycisphaerales bacterium]|nr:Dabb family protein [Phycisphaerales bacterium]